MKYKTKFMDFFPTLLSSVIFILSGVVMIVNNTVAVGVNSRTLQSSGFGGWLLIFIGLIFLVVTYNSISPFSKIRNLFESQKKNNRSKIES